MDNEGEYVDGDFFSILQAKWYCSIIF